MIIKKIKTICLTTSFLILSTSLCFTSFANSLTYTIEQDKVANGDYSKIFAVYDNKNNITFAADFINGGGTFMSNNPYLVNLYTDTSLELKNKKDIGKPFPEASGTKIFTLNNRIYAIRYETATSVMEYNAHANKWHKANIFPNFHDEVIFDIKKYKNYIFSVTNKNIYLDKKIIYSAPHKKALRYAKMNNSNLYLVVYDYHTNFTYFKLCDLNNDKLKNCHSNIIADKKVDVLANGNYDGKTFFSSHAGEVFYIEGKSIYNLYTKPDPNISFQIYSMFNIGEKFVMGQYPDGSLYKVSESNTVEEFTPVTPPSIKLKTHTKKLSIFQKIRILLRTGVWAQEEQVSLHRELQSILKIKNNLVTGIWPWGEVWKFDNKKWLLETRLFNYPTISDEKSPYYEASLKQFDREFDRFGQRVPSMVTLGNKLYIATSSKSGINHQYPDFVKNSEEYGHVYEFEISNSLTCEVNYTDTEKSLLEFVFDEKYKKLAVKQDNKLLCEAYV